jgi:hypothetical protein
VSVSCTYERCIETVTKTLAKLARLTLSVDITNNLTFKEPSMSDGPHRSLPMRPWWRRVAARGDNCNFSPDEVSQALVPALERECLAELRPNFLEGLRSLLSEPTLFSPILSPQAEILDGQARTGLERLVLDNIAVLSPEDAADFNYVQRGLENALRGHAQSYSRQIEEHWQRKASGARTQRIRTRLEDALGTTDFSGVAQRVLRPAGQRSSTSVPQKTGLDDGVNLR